MKMILSRIENPKNNHGLKGADLFTENRRDKDILNAMDEDTYEELITTWAYWCLKKGNNNYEDVLRVGGPGDGGMDVIAFYCQVNQDCDIFQCKHYSISINKSSIIVELGKFLYHVYTKQLPLPRSYYLMAPKGLSATFVPVYTDKVKLKKMIIEEWNSSIADKIEKKHSFKLDDNLKKFLEDFDYSKFQFYSPDKLIKDCLKQENRHVYNQYFGVKKGEIERINKTPPEKIEDYEQHYIMHLVDSYNDVQGDNSITIDNVDSSSYKGHFSRSRDQFWLAESVRKLSEENCPGDKDEFAELEDDMCYHIADVYEEKYDNAFLRVKAVTDKATSLPKKERIISSELGSRELKGICFQLSNKDKLIWKESF